MISLDVTAAQAQSIFTALGIPVTTNLIVYSSVVNSVSGLSEIMNFYLMDNRVTDCVFYPKKADGTYILESTLVGAFPNAIKINAVG